MASAEPPTLDAIARGLLFAGARDAALEFLRAVAERDPEDVASAALLDSLRRGSQNEARALSAPLSLELVDRLVGNGCIGEARAVLRGAKLAEHEAGRQRLAWIDELLDPPPESAAPEVKDALGKIRSAAFVALAALDELHEGPSFPGWLARRRAILEHLLLGGGGPLHVALPMDDTFNAIRGALELVLNRDLEGASRAVSAIANAAPNHPRARLVAAALVRLRHAVQNATDLSAAHVARTLRMDGEAKALLYLQMGNVVEAERYARRAIAEAPKLALAQELLLDLRTVRELLAAPPEPTRGAQLPDHRTAPGSAQIRQGEGIDDAEPGGHVVSKKMSRVSIPGGYLSSRTPPAQSVHPPVTDDAEATGLVSPEQEAELLVKQGYLEQALVLFRRLSRDRPERHAKRIAELESIIVAGATQELTSQKNIRELVDRSNHTPSSDETEIPAKVAPKSSSPDAPARPPSLVSEKTGVGTSSGDVVVTKIVRID